MSAKFDPAQQRKFWLEFGLQHSGHFNPATVPAEVRVVRAAVAMDSLIDACFVGLMNHVRPRFEAIADWMENQSPPDRHLAAQVGDDETGWQSHVVWWRTLGLCKWLSRNDSAEEEFAKALNAEWNLFVDAGPAQAAAFQWDRERDLCEHLALALAGNRPAFGLKLYEAANPQEPMPFEIPVLQFGLWACQHLAAGGKRDADFVARGAGMLRVSLLSNFFLSATRAQSALWLKAIYWDSGVVRTPEQAFAKAYDSMPGIERPDFVPG